MPLTLHIGLPRAASTYLQDSVFDPLPALAKPLGDDAGRRLLWRVGREDQAVFDEAAVGAEIARRCRGLDAAAVVSWEGLSANEGSDRRLRCERLTRLFPEAQVLCVIRRQDGLLRSHYGGAANRGLNAFGMRHFPSIDDWLAQAPKRAPTSLPQTPLDAVAYDTVLREYERAFGRQRLHVVPFEMLTGDKRLFAERLAGVLGIEAGAVLGRLDGPPLRQAVAGNHVLHRVKRSGRGRLAALPGPLGRVGRGITAKVQAALRPQLAVEIGAEWQRRIAERHGPGNRWIAETFGLDLAALGYPGA